MAALGLIETKGLLAAIEAADVMLKAADVRLLEKSLAGGGLVTITVSGEVAAVTVAVDAAVVAAGRLHSAALVSCRVIARPDQEIGRIIALRERSGSLTKASSRAVSAAPVKAESPVSLKPESAAFVGAASLASVEPPAAPPLPDAARLHKMSLSKLRQLAKNLSGLSLPLERIDSAGKNVLIDAIVTAYRQREE